MTELFLEHNGSKFYFVDGREGRARYWFATSKKGARAGQLITDARAKEQFRIDCLPQKYRAALSSIIATDWYDACRKALKAALDDGFNIRTICGRNIPL